MNSLRNIVELVNEHKLIVTLLNWLSQPLEEFVQQQDSVLKLLTELAHKPIGQKKIVEGGGILILRKLETTCQSPKTLEYIQELLSLLLHGQSNPSKTTFNPSKDPSMTESVDLSLITKTIVTKPSQTRSPSPPLRSTRAETWERSTMSPLRRRPSPDTRLKRHYAQDFPPPPHFPNLFMIFEHIYLSPIDEQIVSHFCSMVTCATVDANEESKLFDILSLDFGSQIFLQRSQLFRSIMNGLESESDTRLYQNLEYLDSLTMEWTKLFRKSADTFASISTSTPVNNTPNASVNAATIENFDESSTHGDYSISLPFAAHELFIKLTCMIKYTDLIPLVLRILYGILPFLKIHLETITNKLVRDSEELDPFFIQNMILYYFCHVSDALVVFEEIPMDPYLNQLKEQVISFGLETFSTLSFQCKYAFGLKIVLESLTQNSLVNGVPLSFLSLFCQKPESEELIRQWLILHVQTSHTWVREGMYSFLNHGISAFPQRMLSILENFPLLTFLVQQILSDGKNASQIQSLLNFVLQSSHDLSLLKKFLPWTMCLYSVDQGTLFKLCLERIQPLLNETDKSLIWYFSLLSRDVSLRQFGCHHLDSSVWESSALQEPWNAFCIPSQVLGKFVANEPPRETYRDPKKLFHFAETHIQTLKDEHASMEAKQVALFDLSNSAHLSAIQDHLISQKVIDFLYSLIASPTCWIHDSEILVYALKLIRIVYESRGPHLWKDALPFSTLASFSFSSSPEMRYHLARILFYRFISEYLQPSFGLLQTLQIPEILANHFVTYNPLEILDDKRDFDLDPTHLDLVLESMLNYPLFALVPIQDAIPGQENGALPLLFPHYIGEGIEKLKNAKSHSEFEQSFNEIAGILYLNGDLSSMDLLYPVLQRFIKVTPASADDRCLLSKILIFLGKMFKSQKHAILHDELLHSLQHLFLPLLEEHVKSNDLISKKQSRHSLSHSDATTLGLATEVIGFLANFMKHLDQPELSKLVTCTKCVDIIADFSFHVFSAETGLAKSHYLRLNCLYCLLPFASLPSLLSLTNADTIAHLIRLLVQIIGSFQKTFSNFVDGNAFTYKDSFAYKWAALCLRNLAKSVTNFESGDGSWIWGDHWLYSNDIEWLVIMLNDDEKIMQKFGLGILSNLILIKASSLLLSTKIPRYLDMAFLYVLDFDRHEMLRTEALVIINNFVYLYSQDKSLIAESSQTQPNGTTPLDELIHVFEQSGFFDQLREILDTIGSVSYRSILVELLLNLSLLIPSYLNMKLLETHSWPALIHFLNDSTEAYEAFYTEDHHDSLLYNEFKKKQFTRIYREDLDRIQVQVFKLIRILLYEDDLLRPILIDKTPLVPFLKTLIVKKESSISETCLYACKVLGDLLSIFFQDSKTTLETFFDSETVYGTLLTCFELLKNRDSLESRRVACFLISRLFSLHFGEVVFLDLNVHLESEVSLEDGKTRMQMGIFIFRECTTLLMEHYDPLDLSFMESVRLTLQCLLGRCHFAKNDALEIGLPLVLETRAKSLFSLMIQSKKLDEPSQISLFIILTLFRHLFAGNEQVKMACPSIPSLAYDILSCKDVSEPLVLETLCCLRNFVANCNNTKKLLLAPIRDSTSKCYSSSLPSVLDRVLSLIQRPNVSDDVFFACFELFKILASFVGSRSVLLKSVVTQRLSDSLAIYLKSKNSHRIDAILQYLINLSFSLDGQTQVIRIPGLLPMLFELLSCKSNAVRLSTLGLLSILAQLKENKAHFLVDDGFVGKLVKILHLKSLNLLHASTLLIWILVYDCEKAKVFMKRANLKQELFLVEKRLLSDYHCLQGGTGMGMNPLLEANADVPNLEELSKQDYDLLIQTCRTLNMISRLLK